MKNTAIGLLITIVTLSSSITKADMCSQIDRINENIELYHKMKSNEPREVVTRWIQKDLYDINYRLRTASPRELKNILMSSCVFVLPPAELEDASKRLKNSQEFGLFEVSGTLFEGVIGFSIGGLVTTITGGVGGVALFAGVASTAAAAVFDHIDSLAERVVDMNEANRQKADVEARIAARKQTRAILASGSLAARFNR